MKHIVNSVQALHDDAYSLYNEAVVGGNDYSADSIIANLDMGIKNLESSWKGKDAGVQIENVVKVHNEMVGFREILAAIAVMTSKISANYRDIQNSNGAGLESYGTITSDSKAKLPDYTDNSDTINITQEANVGRANVDAAAKAMDQFIAQVTKYSSNIKNNYTAGDEEREMLLEKLDSFLRNADSYKEILNEVSKSINTSIANYGMSTASGMSSSMTNQNMVQ